MLIAGNWKMNTDLPTARQLASAVVSSVGDPNPVRVAIFPPMVSIDAVFSVIHGSPVLLGAQNVHDGEYGAYTGEVSAPMLRSAGCHYVIVGHSERRQHFGETDETVNFKIASSRANRLVPVVCVGETLSERDAGREKQIVERQIRAGMKGVAIGSGLEMVVAYEPIWAIGTGRTATPEQAQEMHALIRKILIDLFGKTSGSDIDILYGGSMKPGNAAELLSQPDVGGGLIGGASLKAEDFAAIVAAAVKAV
ncbi:MAG: triose-phosphate isomerase [Bacteroidetes bacterium]|nr:MAG: triose-phosphate isomerase [Bacteroidota bacterium]